MLRWGRSSAEGAHLHSHAPVELKGVASPRAVKAGTAVLLLLVALGTVFGLVALWPDQAGVDEVRGQASSILGGTATVRGEVLRVGEACPTDAGQSAQASAEGSDAASAAAPECVLVRVGLTSGPDTGRMVEVPVRGSQTSAGIRAGDRVELVATERVLPEGSAPQQGGSTGLTMNYALAGVDRALPLLLLALLFAVVVVAVGRMRGLLALVALSVSAAVLGFFVLPALVAGGPGLLIGMVGSTAIMFVTLFFVHGPNLRTAAALVGTLFGILFVSGISVIAVSSTRLSGVGDESGGLLAGVATGIDLRGLLTCSILIAGLGVLNDITISQASSVWELRSAAPQMPRREIYARAMRIGRDHIASTVYTVVFAYVGAALGVLLLLSLLDAPVLSLLTREDIAIEIVRTLCGSVGLVLAVPVTTAVAAWFVPPHTAADSADAGGSGAAHPA